MNIFVLAVDPEEAAQYHHDKHVVKMILESAQLLCSAQHTFGRMTPYKPTHVNHPCSLWVRESKSNYRWLVDLARALNIEYQIRFGKLGNHQSYNVVSQIAEPPKEMPDIGLTEFVQAVPLQYQTTCPVTAYRRYYIAEKLQQSKYSVRKRPYWAI